MRVIYLQNPLFQEDDALVTMFLESPEPIEDWTKWKTLSAYGLKCYVSNSGSALNLHRGLTYYPSIHCKEKVARTTGDRKSFMKSVNHPSPSISTVQAWLPKVSFENEQYHESYLSLHQRLLQVHNDSSISLKFPNVIRYPVVLGIDEQETNQGTFVNDNILHGLKEKFDASQLQSIGLRKLPEYIQKECPFVSSAREYRLTDLTSTYCSNVFTQFISGSFDTDDCKTSLDKVIKLSYACVSCLGQKLTCSLEKINQPCNNCSETEDTCISLLVIHVLWDMGSSHKSTSKLIKKITEESDFNDINDPHLFTVAFGGLHILKSPTNHLRNHVLCLNGQNYGVHILRALKNTPGPHSSVISDVKVSVLNGKDRQSDANSFGTTAPLIQETLRLADTYKCTHVPEMVLTYATKKYNEKYSKKYNQTTQNNYTYISPVQQKWRCFCSGYRCICGSRC